MKNNQAQGFLRATYTIQLPRSFVIGLLFSLYVLAFIVSPYWLTPETAVGKFAVLSLLLVFGILWSYFSADAVRVSVNVPGLAVFFLSLLGVLILNFQALRYDIPWRGDEGFHINVALKVIDLFPKNWHKVYLGVWAVFLALAWKKPKWALILAAGGVAGLVFLYVDSGIMPGDSGFIVRYPFVNYLVVSVLPTLVDRKDPYREIFFRILPALSAWLTVWLALRKIKSESIPTQFLWAAAVATTPILFYYSSIFYLEMPALFLMLVVSLNIKGLLTQPLEHLRTLPAWYALILIGFIKETAISFLTCFLLCRAFIFIRRNMLAAGSSEQNSIIRIVRRYIATEVPIALMTLSPLVFYISIRTFAVDTRSFSPNAAGLFDLSIYPVLLRAFMEQFGVLLLFFIAGCILLVLEKEYTSASFHVLTFVFIPLFHVADNPAYAGYSRFNLFIFPVILSGGMIALRKGLNTKKWFGMTAAGLILATNIWASPVYADGSKQSGWGNYFSNDLEYYYPYQEALVWLEGKHRDSSFLFVNGLFSYNYEFYFQQLNWQPNLSLLEDVTFGAGQEAQALSSVLQSAEVSGVDIVLYQVMQPDTVPPPSAGAYHLEKVFANDAGNRLAIYAR